MTALRRLVIEFGQDGIQVRTLYKTADASGPSTRARWREVKHLTREGLRHTLKALDAGDVADLGTSGFTTREDVLGLSLASSDSEKTMKKGA